MKLEPRADSARSSSRLVHHRDASDVIVANGKTKEIVADAKLLEAHGLEKP